MNRIPLLFALMLLASVLLVGCSEETPQLKNGEPAPPFTLNTLGSEPVSFPADLEGKVVAIRFWADWCPFCESEMKLLEPVYQQYRNKGLVILAVNVRQTPDTVESFLAKLNVSYDSLLDREGDVARQYGVMGLPTTFFVSRDGVLKSRILGESTPETFEKIILEML
jgi:thiol-disulfide isomerase/thioredoxin